MTTTLADAWTAADTAVGQEATAKATLVDAETALQAFLDQAPLVNPTSAEADDRAFEGQQARHDVNQAQDAYRVAHHTTLLALATVDSLQTPNATYGDGQGIHAPVGKLATTVIVNDERGAYDAARGPLVDLVGSRVYAYAGTTPPRWIAWEIGLNHPAWTTS